MFSPNACQSISIKYIFPLDEEKIFTSGADGPLQISFGRKKTLSVTATKQFNKYK